MTALTPTRSWCSASTSAPRDSVATSKHSVHTRRTGSPGSSVCRSAGDRWGRRSPRRGAPSSVSPRHEVAEVAIDDDAAYLSTCSATAGLHDAFHAAKGGIASPFALAESAGWFAGPVAAARTLLPPRASLDTSGEAKRPWWKPFGAAPRTAPVVDEVVGVDLHAGLSLEERTLFAEAIVTTIGLAEFAPVVVLCGHGSETVNNPHASSLDCGACGGAPGGASARIAVGDPERCRGPCRARRAWHRDPRRHVVRRRRTRHDGRSGDDPRSRPHPGGHPRPHRRTAARPRRRG